MPESTVEVSIEGMTCDHCVEAVTSALKDIEGVKDVEVSLKEKKAVVTYDDSACKSNDLQAAIQSQGYEGRLYGKDSPISS